MSKFVTKGVGASTHMKCLCCDYIAEEHPWMDAPIGLDAKHFKRHMKLLCKKYPVTRLWRIEDAIWQTMRVYG